MTHFPKRPTRPGHSLIELVVALIASTFLLAGLGSVMLIARHVAYTPSAAVRRTQAAEVVNQMADELRFATLISQPSTPQPHVLEFVVTDRYADGTAEKIRYEWSGTVGQPLYRTLNGTPSAIIQNVQDCTFSYDTIAASTSPVTRTHVTRAIVRLQTGEDGHSRVDAAIPLVGRPERLGAYCYWRTDFDANPTTIDANADAASDWVASGGATFVAGAGAGQLTAGTWSANGDLSTNPPNPFTAVTIVEARCKNTATSGSADVLRIDRQTGTNARLVVRMQRQLDGSQTLTLLVKPASGAESPPLKVVDNLSDDYVRFQLIIYPDTTPNTYKVSLQINDVGDDVLGGPFTYSLPAATDRCVKIGGDAKFDYLEVRVLAN